MPGGGPAGVEPGLAVALPDPVRDLLVREAWDVAEVEEVTSLPTPGAARSTFRVRLADGRAVKVRVHRYATVVERMTRWLPRLAPDGFAPLLAADGRTTVEAWVDGRPAPRDDEGIAEHAGGLLGACHDALPREEVPEGDPRLVRWTDDALRWVAAIQGAGRLPAERADRIRRRLHEDRPRAATWGLSHGDFSAENLVVSERGLVSVDNTTVRPDVLEVDLGFLWNRWPMRPSQRGAFLRGYRRRGDPARFLRHERFWCVTAALQSAAWRLREGTGSVDLPLHELASRVP